MAIQMQTSLDVADNSGARRVEMIMSIGGSTGRTASLGDKIKVTVKEAAPDGAVKKGTVHNAVIVRTRKEVRRKDGTYIRFDQTRACSSAGRHADRDARLRPRRQRTPRPQLHEDRSLAPEVI